MSNIMNISGVDCYEENGTVYLKLEAVARGLGFTTTQNVNGTEYVNVRWKTVEQYLKDIGFLQEVAKNDFIPENVFYRLAMKAKNETAERFQAMVADEIIPSIRKNGGYIAGQESMTDDELIARALLVAQNKIEERDKIIAAQQAQIESDKPKAIFADAVSASKTSILVGELSKILKQNGIDIGQNRLFEWMRNNGYLIKSGSSRNLPTQKSMDRKLFEIKERTVNSPDGCIKITKTPLVTGKGQVYFQVYFVNAFLNELKGCATK